LAKKIKVWQLAKNAAEEKYFQIIGSIFASAKVMPVCVWGTLQSGPDKEKKIGW